MNKPVKRITATLLGAICVMGMAACGGQHTCQPSGVWSSDKTGHWHACTGADCDEKLDFGAHSYTKYGNSQCECGHFDTTKATSAEILGAYYDAPDGSVVSGRYFTDTVLIFPETFDDGNMEHDITVVNAEAFYENTTLQAVGLSEKIYMLEDSAFEGCTALETVYFPVADFLGSKALASVGNGAFAGCTSLTKLYFGDEKCTWYIGNSAFIGCGFVSLTLPTGTKEIGDFAFEGCQQLQTITIPAGIEYIGMYAFDKCPALRTVNFGGTKAQFEEFLGDSNEVGIDDPADWLFLDKDQREPITVNCSDGSMTL